MPAASPVPSADSAAEWWRQTYLQPPLSVVRDVQSLAECHGYLLGQAFCAEMVVAQGRLTLLADVVQPGLAGMEPVRALVPSIERWLAFLFDEANRDDCVPTLHVQSQLAMLLAGAGLDGVGTVHAFHRLKRALAPLLRQVCARTDDVVAAQAYVHQLLDLALDAVMTAWNEPMPPAADRPMAHQPGPPVLATSTVAVPSAPDEAVLERERLAQLSVLSEEENRYLRSVLEFGSLPDMRLLGSSMFGIWLNQRAPLLFEGSVELGELERIGSTLSHLDGSVLPRLGETLASGAGTRKQAALVREALADIADIRRQINTLFDRLTLADGYRDALTQLFSRPFLPTILKREIEVARRRRSHFSVVILQLANLPDVTTHHGPQMGDRMLQHVAAVLSQHVRATDYVFRYSESAFLILFAELGADDAEQVAQKILRTVTQADAPDGGTGPVPLRLHLGLAPFDGDPDPQRLIDRADSALAKACEQGAGDVAWVS